jgi:hypothetical protein
MGHDLDRGLRYPCHVYRTFPCHACGGVHTHAFRHPQQSMVWRDTIDLNSAMLIHTYARVTHSFIHFRHLMLTSHICSCHTFGHSLIQH